MHNIISGLRKIADDTIIFAVAHGDSKTIVYPNISESLVETVLTALSADLDAWNSLRKTHLKGLETLATNNSDDGVAEEAEEAEDLAAEADVWIDIYDMESVKEALNSL